MRLSSAAFLDAESHDDPNVAFARVLELSEGLIALTGGGDGALAPLIAQGKGDIAIDALKQLGVAFPNRLYVELQRHGEVIEAETEGPLLEMAYDLGLPIVATNDIRFEKKADTARTMH